MVSYDLNNPGQKYGQVYEYLKSHERWAHALDSLWFVTTDKSPTEIRDELMNHGVDTNDSLVVLDVTGDSWAARNSSEVIEWLTNILPARNPFFG